MSTSRERQRCSHSGFSLFETVVAGALTLLVLTMLYLMLNPGLNRWLEGRRRSTVQQHGLVAMYRMVHDLELTCIQSVWCDDPDNDFVFNGHHYQRLSFLSPMDSQGHMEAGDDESTTWRSYRVFYLDKTTNELWLGNRDLQHEQLNDKVIKVQLRDFTPGHPLDRRLCRYVRQIRMSLAVDPNDLEAVANPVKITMRLEHEDVEQNFVTSVSALLAFN